MSSSFDRVISRSYFWASVGATCSLVAFGVACGGATSSPETVPDGSTTSPGKDGGTTTKHDGASTTDGKTTPQTDTGTTPPVDAKTGTDAPTGTDAAGCPAATPMQRSACTTTGEKCTYGDTSCTCAGGAGGMTGWACKTCPAAQPTEGATCTAMGGGGGGGGGGACAYGDTDCACVNGAWACSSCPAAAPAAGSTCEVGGQICGYDAGACRCSGNGGGGMMGGTDAGTTDAAATDAAAADAAGVDSGMTTMHTETWRCGSACPAAAPMTGAACTVVAGEQCAYGTTTCECLQDKFVCN